MKRIQNTKKIICFILAVSMLLSLTACGQKTEAQGVSLYALAKGITTAKLTLKISGKFPEGTSPVISYINQEIQEYSLVPIISVSEKSVKANGASYIVTGLSPGTDDLVISFVKDEISYSKITAQITVDPELKISECRLNILETPDKYVYNGGIVTDNADDYILRFSVPDEDFNWEIGSYDDEILEITGPYHNEEEGTTEFEVKGKEEGESHLELINKDDGKKIDVVIDSYEHESEDGEKETYVKVISSDEEEYDGSMTVDDIREINQDIITEEYTDEDGEVTEVTSSSVRIENLYIPQNYEIVDATSYNDAKENPVIQIEMNADDAEFFINAWGKKSLAEVRSDVTDKDVRETLQNTTIAGIATEYYNVSGVDLFLFEREDVVYLVSFGKESDMEAHSKIVESIKWVK